MKLPPIPEGFELDQQAGLPPLPDGFELEGEARTPTDGPADDRLSAITRVIEQGGIEPPTFGLTAEQLRGAGDLDEDQLRADIAYRLATGAGSAGTPTQDQLDYADRLSKLLARSEQPFQRTPEMDAWDKAGVLEKIGFSFKRGMENYFGTKNLKSGLADIERASLASRTLKAARDLAEGRDIDLSQFAIDYSSDPALQDPLTSDRDEGELRSFYQVAIPFQTPSLDYETGEVTSEAGAHTWSFANEGALRLFLSDYSRSPEAQNLLQHASQRYAEAARESIRKYAENQKASAKVPISADFLKLAQAKTFGDAIESFTESPGDITLEAVVSNVPVAIEMMISSTIAGRLGRAHSVAAGRAAATAATYLESLGIDAGAELIDALDEQGVDIRDPAAVESALSNPSIRARTVELATAHAVPVALLDAVAMLAATKRWIPRPKGALGRAGTEVAEQVAIQPTAGMAGEALGQIAQTGEITKPGGVLLEGIAEVAPHELATAAMAGLRGDKTQTRGGDDASAVSRDAGQVPESGTVPEGGEEQGRPDLQQPTPGEPGGTGVRPEAQGAQAADVEFETAFPQPTDAAKRELIPGDHYPDPEDREQVAKFHDNVVKELIGMTGQLEDIESAIRDGIDPRTGKPPKPKDAKKLKTELEDARDAAKEAMKGTLSQYADIYGPEAADRLKAYARKVYDADESYMERGERLDEARGRDTGPRDKDFPDTDSYMEAWGKWVNERHRKEAAETIQLSQAEYEEKTDKAYSARTISEKGTIREPLIHNGTPITVTGRVHSPRGDTATGWTLVPKAEWKGGKTYAQQELHKLWDKGTRKRGDQRGMVVKWKGKEYVLDKRIHIESTEKRKPGGTPGKGEPSKSKAEADVSAAEPAKGLPEGHVVGQIKRGPNKGKWRVVGEDGRDVSGPQKTKQAAINAAKLKLKKAEQDAKKKAEPKKPEEPKPGQHVLFTDEEWAMGQGIAHGNPKLIAESRQKVLAMWAKGEGLMAWNPERAKKLKAAWEDEAKRRAAQQKKKKAEPEKKSEITEDNLETVLDRFIDEKNALAEERRAKGDNTYSGESELERALAAAAGPVIDYAAWEKAAEWARKNGRPDIAEALVVRALRSARRSAEQKPGLSPSSPKYAAALAALKKNAEEAAAAAAAIERAARGASGEVKSEIDEKAHEAATSPENNRPEPTPDQKKAGNYKKGPLPTLHGLGVMVENPKGSYRWKLDTLDLTAIANGAIGSARRRLNAIIDKLKNNETVPQAFSDLEAFTKDLNVPDAYRASVRKVLKRGWRVKMAHHYGYFVRVDGQTAPRGKDKDHIDVFVGPEPENASLPVFVIDQVHQTTRKLDEHKVMLGFADEAAAREGYLANYEKGWQGLGGIKQFTLDEFKEWLAKGNKQERVAEPDKSKALKKKGETKAKTDAVGDFAAKWDAMGYDGRQTIAQASVYGNMRKVVHRISGSKWAALSPGEQAEIRKASEKLSTTEAEDAEAKRKTEAAERKKRIDAATKQVFSDLAGDQGLLEAVTHLTPADFAKRVKEGLKKQLDELMAEARRVQDTQQIDAIESLLDENGNPKASAFGADFERSVHAEVLKRHRAAERAKLRESWAEQIAAEFASAAAKHGITDINISVQGKFFRQGFDHALDGKTKSSLPQDNLTILAGYEAGMSWLGTEEGRQFAKGIKGKKMAGTDALRRMEDGFKKRNRDLDAIDPNKIEEAIQTIFAVTVRSEVFPIVPGEGATPGTTRYLEVIRDSFYPFKEYFRRRYAFWRSRRSIEEQITQFIEGSPEKMESLRKEAKAYVERMEKIAEALAGSMTVKEVADKLIKVFADNEDLKNNYHRYMRHSPGRLYNNAGTYATNENEEDGPGSRKEPLRRPRFDRVTRSGFKDYRKGRDISAEELQNTFGFAGITYGEWVTSKQRQDHTNYAFDAFHDLAETLGIPLKAISLGGEMHLAFGALGKGRHAAHYNPAHPHPSGGSVPVINLTNTQGDGTLAHEWGHAVDFALRGRHHGSRVAKQMANAVRDITQLLRWKLSDRTEIERYVRGFLDRGMYWNHIGAKRPVDNVHYTVNFLTGQLNRVAQTGDLSQVTHVRVASTTKYALEADRLGENYWGKPEELWARAFEAWLYDKLVAAKGESTYLVTDWVSDGKVTGSSYRGRPYPTGDERAAFNAMFEGFFKDLAWDEKGPRVPGSYQSPLKAWAEERKRDLLDYAETLPKNEQELAAFRAKEEAEKRRKKDEEERKKAEELAKQYQESQSAQQPGLVDELQSMSQDDIENLFDAVAAEKEEAEQEGRREGETTAPEQPPAPRTEPLDRKALGGIRLAQKLADRAEGKLTWQELFKLADEAFGGTQAEGAYLGKDAYDAMEVALNMRVRATKIRPSFGTHAAKIAMKDLRAMDDAQPTQTKRSLEQEEFQQFSTPHDYAYAAAWAANLTKGDVVMEPSAGTGNIAIMAALAPGVSVITNELAGYRAALLRALELGPVYTENAEQIHNILPADVKPTVVLMNPPFSATAGRMAGKRVLTAGATHIEQALKRLQPGGRLIAIVGRGMAMDRPTFKDWWNRIKAEYTVRANVGVSGAEYSKFGTSFDTQILVIDKTGPTTGDIVTGQAENIADLLPLLEGVRNARVHPGKSYADQRAGEATAEAGSAGGRPGDVAQSRADALGAGGGQGRPAGEEPSGGRGDVGSAAADATEGRDALSGGGREPGRGAADRGRDQGRGAGQGGAAPAQQPARQDVGDDSGVSAPVSKSASQIIGEAARHGVKGIDETLKGLHELFGGNKLKTFPGSIDEETYRKAKPHFERALKEFIAAGRSVKEFVRFVIDNFGTGIKPYIVQFLEEYKREGKPAQPDASTPESLEVEKVETKGEKEELTDNIFEQYKPHVTAKGAKPHPGRLVESAAMSSVKPPETSYQPNLPKETIEQGKLSDAQLEAIILAGAAHEQILPEGQRRGFFIGDGTGVGKGREISGIIYDNWRRGRKKAVWISEKQELFNDAQRDYSGIGADPKALFNLSKINGSDTIQNKEGILYSTYATLKSQAKDQTAHLKSGMVVVGPSGKAKIIDLNTGRDDTVLIRLWSSSQTQEVNLRDLKDEKGNPLPVSKKAPRRPGKRRLDQIVEWLGPEFDGVVVFDESHNMGNNMEEQRARGRSQASATALAGIELQQKLPKARFVYVSATGATEVSNLGYAERLGLWGRGTPFANKQAFVAQVTSGGIAAMELIAKDMKALGVYIARSLAYDDVTYGMLEHPATPEQVEIYNELAGAWQIVLRAIKEAMQATGVTGVNQAGNVRTLNRDARSRAMSAFWSSHQRFFNQILTSMQMPTAVKSIEEELKRGNVAVLQLVNTNEAAQERAVARMEAEGQDIEDLDITPREVLIQYLQHNFPIQQYEEYIDENGNRRSRPVVDSQGNPVINPEAVKIRDALIMKLGAIRVPEGPLEQVINYFGSDRVAEVTGRKRRYVRMEKDGREQMVEQKLGNAHALADANAFMDGKKDILIFSDKGGTGRSYHADRTAKNQKRRIHYLVQPGWRANKAVQGFGRTHRSNEANAPHYVLLTTDLKAQRRFLSSIARRLDQLGALTKGQRQTGSQGIFSAEFNLETQYADDALFSFFTDLRDGHIEGLDMKTVEDQMGLEVTDKDGNITTATIPTIPRFLNRLLSLKTDVMDKVFDAFFQRLEDIVENARLNGTLDVGLENIAAEKVEKVNDQVVHKDEKSGAETHYVELKLTDPVHLTEFDQMMARALGTGNPPLFFAKNKRSGRVYAFLKGRNFTNKEGQVVERYRRIGVISDEQVPRGDVGKPGEWGFNQKWDEITDIAKAKEYWLADMEAAPKYKHYSRHLITGAVLPIWDRLIGKPRIMRAQTDDGERMIGRLIAEKDLGPTLQRLGAERKIQLTPAEAVQKVMDDNAAIVLANGWRILRRTISGEQRMEVVGVDYGQIDAVQKEGVFAERIGYQTRFFIPTGAKAEQVMAEVIRYRPITDIVGGTPAESGVRFAKGRRGPADKQMSVGEIRQIVQPVIDKLTVKPSINVVRNIGDLPRYLVQDILRAGATNTRGIFDGRSEAIYLIADALTSEEDALRTLFHELHGHYGGRLLFGKEYDRFLNRVFLSYGKSGLAEIAKDYQLDLNKPEHRLIAADEKLAQIAEEVAAGTASAKARLLWNRFVGWVKDWLRRHGFRPAWVNRLTDADLHRVIVMAERRMTRTSGRMQPRIAAVRMHRAYHGSPHEFEEFSIQKIGTGEGAQAFGWGLYFSGKMEVAEYYRDSLRYKTDVGSLDGVPYSELEGAERHVVRLIAETKGDVDAALKLARLHARGALPEYRQQYEDRIRVLETVKRGERKVEIKKGHLYVVELAPAEEEYLYWDKPISEQSDQVRRQLADGGLVFDQNITGGQIYDQLTQKWDARLGDIESAQRRASEELLALGIPGLKYLDQGSRERGEGTYNYVIFDDKLVKVDTRFSQKSQDIRFSLRKTGDKDLDSLLGKIGAKPKTLRERFEGVMDGLGEGITQGLFDRFYGIKRALDSLDNQPVPEQDGYIAARFTTSLPAQVLRVLRSGPMEWRQGMAQVKRNSKGLLEIFQPVADKLDLWSAYMVAKRAQRLALEKRENLLTDEEINRGMRLAVEHPEFEQVAKDWADFNRATLDFAQEAGLIDPENRAMWEHDDYVPFYRLLEEQVTGPRGHKGLSHQTSGIRALKGGEEGLNDILENIVQNTVHLIDASMKNHAMRLTAQALAGSDYVTPAPFEAKPELIPMSQVKQVLESMGVNTTRIPKSVFRGIQKMLAIKVPKGRDVVMVRENGHPKFYRVHDELLLRSMTSINQVKFGPWMRAFRAPKRWLTTLVTADPGFMLRNWTRDTLHAFVIGRDRMTPVLSGVKGVVKAMRETEILETIEAAGAGFHGGYIHAGDPEAVAKVIKAELRHKDFQESLLDSPRKLWDWWMDVSYAFENANRIAVAEAALKAGKPPIQAAYEFKDLMDFSMHGDWQVVQFLVQTVPFLGARLQGLQRLGRGAAEKPAAFLAKGSLIMFASLALFLRYMDDERYKELEDWDKNTYYHFWIGQKHFRIPKPFEVGAVFSTIPERMTEYLFSDLPDAEKRLLKQLRWVFAETFNFGSVQMAGVPVPAPQTVAPILEQWANVDSFTQRPIVSQHLQRLRLEAQYDPWTSATARELGAIFGISPKRVEHLVNGYLGTLGSYALGASDVVVRRLKDYPKPPATRLEDMPIIRSFYRGEGPPRHIRQTTEFYELMKEVDSTWATVLDYRKRKNKEGARGLITDERDKLRLRKMVHTTSDRLAGINKKIRAIHEDRSLTPEEKRRRLDELTARRNEITREAMRRIERKQIELRD